MLIWTCYTPTSGPKLYFVQLRWNKSTFQLLKEQTIYKKVNCLLFNKNVKYCCKFRVGHIKITKQNNICSTIKWHNKKKKKIVTKFKNSKCDITQKLNMWQNSKTQNMTKLKKSKCDKTQKLKMWQNLKTKNL